MSKEFLSLRCFNIFAVPILREKRLEMFTNESLIESLNVFYNLGHV